MKDRTEEELLRLIEGERSLALTLLRTHDLVSEKLYRRQALRSAQSAIDMGNRFLAKLSDTEQTRAVTNSLRQLAIAIEERRTE